MDRCIKTNISDRWTGVSGRILVIGGQVCIKTNRSDRWTGVPVRILVIGGQVYQDEY